MSEAEREDRIEELAEAMEDREDQTASAVMLSKEGENTYIVNQALYRKLDHERWNERQDRLVKAQINHIDRVNRHNLINTALFVAALAIIVGVLLGSV